MKATAIALLCLLCVSGFLNAAGWLDLKNARQERDAAKAAEEIALARYAEAATAVDVRVDTVKRWKTRWDTTYRDTGSRITDTVWVKATLAVADTTIRACTSLLTACETFRRVADSTLAAKDRVIASLRPSWRDRCGLMVGVGALRDGSVVRAGPTVSVGCKLWP